MIAREAHYLAVLLAGCLALGLSWAGRSALAADVVKEAITGEGQAKPQAKAAQAAESTELAQVDDASGGGAADPSPLAELAEQFNSLLVQDQPIALACVIGNGTVDSITTTYHRFPFLKNADSTYTSAALWSVVYRIKGNPDRVQSGDVTVRITSENGKPVMIFESSSFSPTPQDLVQVGNGIISRERNAGQGDIESVEYLRKPDGTVVALQRYKNLATVVIYNAVPPPPELVKRAQEQVLQQAGL